MFQQFYKLNYIICKIVETTKFNLFVSIKEKNNNKYYKLIIYNNDKIKFEKIDKTFGELYAKQLGNFYKCSSNNWNKVNHRITITCYPNCELYYQMCSKQLIAKNMNFFIKILDELKIICNKLDKNIELSLNIV